MAAAMSADSGGTLVLVIASRMAASSTSAGITSNVSPAASSIALRAALPDARINRVASGIGRFRFRLLSGFSILEKLKNHRRRFFDRTARHIDDRPTVLSGNFSRVGNFGRDRIAIDIALEIAICHQHGAVTANVGNPIDVSDKADDEGFVRFEEF